MSNASRLSVAAVAAKIALLAVGAVLADGLIRVARLTERAQHPRPQRYRAGCDVRSDARWN